MEQSTYYAENKNSIVQLDKNEIFIIQWKAVKLEVEDFKTVVDIFAEWSDGKALKVLHIFPKGASASGEARSYGTQREKKSSAEAFVIENPIQRSLFKLYQRFRSRLYPVRAFSQKESAIQWLNSLKIETEEEAVE
jgi:hypothetical protein